MMRLDNDLPGVSDPHGRAVEVNQHPLVRVEVEAVGELDPVQKGPELGTYEGASGVGSIHVEPETLNMEI